MSFDRFNCLLVVIEQIKRGECVRGRGRVRVCVVSKEETVERCPEGQKGSRKGEGSGEGGLIDGPAPREVPEGESRRAPARGLHTGSLAAGRPLCQCWAITHSPRPHLSRVRTSVLIHPHRDPQRSGEGREGRCNHCRSSAEPAMEPRLRSGADRGERFRPDRSDPKQALGRSL